jgi:5-methylcytosine-specific restriction protein A
MANRARKYCSKFPCSNLAEPGSSYCREHQPAAPVKQADPFYLSVAGRRFRTWYLGQHPLCEQCEREGRLPPARLVHHAKEIKDGGARLEDSNVVALCDKCHGEATDAISRRGNHRKLLRK